MLHNRLSQLFTKESDRLLKSFLGDNEDLLKKYVSGGVVAVGAILGPINAFMRHLLVVQGLDPNTVPGERQRLLTQQALTSFFESKHDKDFDEDYDMSWVRQRFEDTRKNFSKFNLTQAKFTELTDISKLGSGRYPTAAEEQEIFRTRVTPEPDKRELNIGDPIKDLVAELKKQGGDPKPTGIKTTKKKLNKGKRVGTGPKVQRVTSAEPVQEGPSTLKVESDRKVRAPARSAHGRDLSALVQEKKAQNKAALEATPEFQKALQIRTERATELTQLMIDKGLCEPNDKARQEQINQMINWGENNFDALERVIFRYAPTKKDAIAENKFKGSFRRVQK